MNEIIKTKSEINYSYATIRMTQSRINKGLIAIPASLEKWFPDHADTIHVYLDDSPILRSGKIAMNEYYRLINTMSIKERQSVRKQLNRVREKAPLKQ